MARFRLKAKHYLNVPGTTWEQTETDQTTGRRARKTFDVPLYLNPDDSMDCNYPGEIIVSTQADPRFPRDIVFTGPPTPDMEPLDEEAERLHLEYMQRFGGEHPIESLQATGVNYSDRILEDMQKKLAHVESRMNVEAELVELRRQNEEFRKRLEGVKRA